MLAIIGGTGLGELALPGVLSAETVTNRFGKTDLETGTVLERPVIFLPRHGKPARIPPHMINYRANIEALADAGVTDILAVTAVGSVDPDLEVGELIVPDQIVDYTSGRAHTFFDDEIQHIDFTSPYHEPTRQVLGDLLLNLAIKHSMCGVYGCTEGPRLETAAEIKRMAGDGCTIVGMTAMPEAALARERGLNYTGVSVVVNKGAGMEGTVLDLETIHEAMSRSMEKVRKLLVAFLERQMTTSQEG